MEKPCRADYFTIQEQTIILQQYEEVNHIIQAKSNTDAAKARKKCWQKIADPVNAQIREIIATILINWTI